MVNAFIVYKQVADKNIDITQPIARDLFGIALKVKITAMPDKEKQ